MHAASTNRNEWTSAMTPLRKVILILLAASIAACAAPRGGNSEPTSDMTLWPDIAPFCCASSAS